MISPATQLPRPPERSSKPETRIVYRGFALSGSVGGSRPTLAGPSSYAPEDSFVCQCDFKPELNLEICLPVQDKKN